MKKTFLILIILLLGGCTLNKENINKDNQREEENKKEESEIKEAYQDNNPIKLGIFSAEDTNYHNKEVIDDEYVTSFTKGVDLGSFEVIFTDQKVIDGNKFKDTWYTYYNQYENIDNYKIGYNIKFTSKDGTVYEGNFLEPDIFKFEDYFYVYLYDDINQKDGAFYSHLEEITDDNIITSIKIYGVGKIEELENIELTAFTYDGEEDFDKEENYRGNSIYKINIKKK